MALHHLGDLSLHGTSRPVVVLGGGNETIFEPKHARSCAGLYHGIAYIGGLQRYYERASRQQRAMDLLEAIGGRSAAFNSDRDWMLAEMVIAWVAILVGRLQQRADLGSLRNPWVERYGLKSLALPCSSELLALPVCAVYGRGVANVDVAGTLDVPVLSVVSGASASACSPAASREQMVEMLSCMPHIVKGNRSLDLLLGIAKDGMAPRLCARIVAPVDVNNCVVAPLPVVAEIGVDDNKDREPREDLTCWQSPSVIDIFIKHPRGADAIVVPKLTKMKNGSKHRATAPGQDVGSVESSTRRHAVKSAGAALCASSRELNSNERFDTVLGDTAESPFSARKMFLTFVGRPKKEPYEPS